MQSVDNLVQEFIKNRSDGTFTVLYRRLTPEIYRLALYLSRYDKFLAEELLQEMWIVGIRQIHEFQGRSSFKTWLSGILINLLKQKRRKDTLHQSKVDEMANTYAESYMPDHATAVDLKKAIMELPDRYNQVIVLHDIEGYTHKEIAEILSIHEGTSKSQLHHARKALRLYLNDNLK